MKGSCSPLHVQSMARLLNLAIKCIIFAVGQFFTFSVNFLSKVYQTEILNQDGEEMQVVSICGTVEERSRIIFIVLFIR